MSTSTVTGIRCGHCHGRHATVAEVRSCAVKPAPALRATSTDEVFDERPYDTLIQQAERTEDEAVARFKMRRWEGEETSAQALLRQRASLADGERAAERIEASAAKPRYRPAMPDQKVEDGRYAVEEDGVLKFFRLKNGRKAGYVFLDIQASDEWHAIRNVTRIRSIVALIARDAHGAMIRYGHELGVCGRCGRTLTDEASRAAGIGPVCAGKQ